MMLIQKTREPNELQVHRGIAGTNYESFKSDVGLGDLSPATGLRKSLLEEQGYICAYCMKRIPHSHTEKGISADKMKVEHFIAQTNKKSISNNLDITYTNMLACCMGNQGKNEKYETCDTRKGEKILTISPLNNAHVRTIKYAPDGSIHSTNEIFEVEINKILNLNENNLKKQREALFNVLKGKVIKEFSKPHLTRLEKNNYLDKEINWWNSKKGGKFKEFCMVAITYFESRKTS